MQESLIDELGLKEEYKLVTQVGNKLIFAHTTYYEIEEPDYEQFITEDDTPVDNIFSEMQQRLLIDPLHVNQWTERDFWASSNVGIYYAIDKPCVVPDMFLSFNVKKPETWFDKKDKCYFTWVVGKSPDLVVEVISNKIGKEDEEKMAIYARMGVSYYILIDPYLHLYPNRLNVFELTKNHTYERLENEFAFMEEVNLGIMIWEGLFEKEPAPWGRWCTKEGNVLLTGAERAEQEAQRAEQEAQRAEQEAQRAEQEAQRAERLLAQLRALGLEPDV
ncbi:MAG: Uma2 family endonuclease [Microscillaceae bacterium]|jgi:Uma2 family endonuclease|nr:Uma2 family endonuclease [Microscillaceae bacterium]